MANKQEQNKDKKEEVTKEKVETSPKKETKNMKTKKPSSKTETVQNKVSKMNTSKKKSENSSINKKTKSTGTKKSDETKNTNSKVETKSKKTSKTKGNAKQNSNSQKNESIKSENNEENAVAEVKEEVVKLEEIKSTLNKKNKISKEKLEEIYGLVFKNIAIAAVVIIYFIFLNLGQMNIKPDIYQTDLKVFSITSLLISIVLFEKAYKKDSGEIAIYGIEMLILAIVTLSLIYINLMFSSRYVFIVNSISCIFAIYYLIKSVIVYIKKRKKCYIDDMKEIINKEEE